MTFIFKNRCAKYFIIVLLLGSASSCTEVWDLKTDGDNSEVAHTLCVAANATIAGGELSFAAAVAPVRSDVVKYDSYPLDGLRLELIVDGVSYCSDSLENNDLFGKESGFRIERIPVETKTPTVEMIIKDSLGNYNTVMASATAMQAPEMNAEVTATKVETKERSIVTQNGYRLKRYSYNGCDSIYVANIKFRDAPGKRDYYMVAVEFECMKDLFSISSGQDLSGNYPTTHYDGMIDFFSEPGFWPTSYAAFWLNSFGTYDQSKWRKMGYSPFSSNDDVFRDEKITSSVFGFETGFSNVFDDSSFDGTDKTITISFENLFPQICKTDYRKDVWGYFSSNAETPFHIHLAVLDEHLYNNYKKVMYHLCSGKSLYDITQSFSSNIDGGLGFFSVLNCSDYFYYDDTVYGTVTRY